MYRGNESQISNSENLNHCSESLSVLNQQQWTFQRAPKSHKLGTDSDHEIMSKSVP